MGRIFVCAGSLAGALAVAAGAVAAHALPKGMDAAGVAAVRSAVQMGGWHALALVAAGLWVRQAPASLSRLLGVAAGWGFLAGMLLFCGAILAHHLAGLPTGSLAPFGGVTLILSWLVLAASALAAS
jgi:uncharacterized membrane protein YgdD (TMEM256/DUF423 family)